MKLELVRTYFPEGTNGQLQTNGMVICQTIELPWKENQPGVSCIPEGKYVLVKRYSKKFGWHLLVEGTVSRSLILVHPANDAKKELRGCIAPVSTLIGHGKGTQSRLAFKKLIELVYHALEKQESIHLTITSSPEKNKGKTCERNNIINS